MPVIIDISHEINERIGWICPVSRRKKRYYDINNLQMTFEISYRFITDNIPDSLIASFDRNDQTSQKTFQLQTYLVDSFVSCVKICTLLFKISCSTDLKILDCELIVIYKSRHDDWNQRLDRSLIKCTEGAENIEYSTFQGSKSRKSHDIDINLLVFLKKIVHWLSDWKAMNRAKVNDKKCKLCPQFSIWNWISDNRIAPVHSNHPFLRVYQCIQSTLHLFSVSQTNNTKMMDLGKEW
jgi:hypothetical protein